MVGKSTKVPTYDYNRGEPRGKLKKDMGTSLGDCIDCNQCVAVCPTGVDIKMGQEYGCITCGLCIDACDTVMEKVGKEKGLIRYMSLNALNGTPDKSIFKRKRLIAYALLLFPLVWTINYGVKNAKELDLRVTQERQPLFIKLSNGEYRNKYELKIKNKGSELRKVRISVNADTNIKIMKNEKPITVTAGGMRHKYIYLVSRELGNREVEIIIKDGDLEDKYLTKFFTPEK
jgi:cytochrome c oxidase accessory protein FixG